MLTKRINDLKSRKKAEEIRLKYVLTLCGSNVTVNTLRAAVNLMTKLHYDNVVEDRSFSKRCGYPLCNNQLSDTGKQRFSILQNYGVIVDVTEAMKYCSKRCFAISRHLRRQLTGLPHPIEILMPGTAEANTRQSELAVPAEHGKEVVTPDIDIKENPSNVAALHVKVSPTLSYNSIEGYDPEDFDRHLTQFKTKHNGGIKKLPASDTAEPQPSGDYLEQEEKMWQSYDEAMKLLSDLELQSSSSQQFSLKKKYAVYQKHSGCHRGSTQKAKEIIASDSDDLDSDDVLSDVADEKEERLFSVTEKQSSALPECPPANVLPQSSDISKNLCDTCFIIDTAEQNNTQEEKPKEQQRNALEDQEKNFHVESPSSKDPHERQDNKQQYVQDQKSKRSISSVATYQNLEQCISLWVHEATLHWLHAQAQCTAQSKIVLPTANNDFHDEDVITQLLPRLDSASQLERRREVFFDCLKQRAHPVCAYLRLNQVSISVLFRRVISKLLILSNSVLFSPKDWPYVVILMLCIVAYIEPKVQCRLQQMTKGKRMFDQMCDLLHVNQDIIAKLLCHFEIDMLALLGSIPT